MYETHTHMYGGRRALCHAEVGVPGSFFLFNFGVGPVSVRIDQSDSDVLLVGGGTKRGERNFYSKA